MPTESIRELLRQIPFLQAIPPDHLQALAEAGEVLELQAGETVFQEGDLAEDLYLILSGRLSVQGHNQQGREISLSGLETGQFFGELALAEHGTRSATVRSDTDTKLFRLGRDEFVRLLGQAPELLSQVMGAISQKIRNANTHFFQEQLLKQALQLKMQREHHQSVARLIAGMADEIQSPLKNARELAGELEKTALEGNQRENCFQLQAQLRQLQQLVETFRAISAEQIEDQPESVSFQSLLEEFQEIYSMSSDRQLPIELTLTPEAAHATWTGYPGILQTILMHLITNAEIHAYPDGKGPVGIMVTMRGQASERFFELSFSDRGEGMEPELLAEATRPFVSTRRSESHSGLGLAVVESLVTGALGGKMEIKSEPGKGTRVILRIPVQAPLPR
ncbi:MAG: cyclic nucleotide-binding domain-containing protein [Candidatus Sericytochromatia bacterium]